MGSGWNSRITGASRAQTSRLPANQQPKVGHAVTEVTCIRCGQQRPGIDSPPFRDELGTRIHENICQVCWDEWLQRQMQLINHYALDVRTPEARDFLRRNVEAFLFEVGDADGIDPSQQGKISW